jgi:Uma2 family endonuclease
MVATISELEEYQTEDVMSVNHSYLTFHLSLLLANYRNQYSIMPELEFDLTAGRAKPDISICKPLKIDWKHDVVRLSETPISVIEILSPRQAFTDLTDKVYDIYFPSGVKTCWIIIPTIRTITLFTVDDEKTITEGIIKDPVTGIELDLAEIFG